MPACSIADSAPVPLTRARPRRPRGRLGEAADRRVAGRRGLPRGELLRLARAAHHRVAVVQEAVAEDLTDLAGSENADLRHGGTLSRRSPSSDPECAPPGPDDR